MSSQFNLSSSQISSFYCRPFPPTTGLLQSSPPPTTFLHQRQVLESPSPPPFIDNGGFSAHASFNNIFPARRTGSDYGSYFGEK
ncbi:hypothetical protein MIMGU_mgv1a018653mg [Erythranthe guttata]|uniref:Uncharacterized protein n=1 Tax=Erythranthe guttata TaxID=4155 RepID=A0A022Q201_ERYGU|nr:hypothetical protein MIMGU_mgv1a018653mg [Erythranthe guttata]